MTVVQETGATVSFFPDGAGGWEAPERMEAVLDNNGDGTWTFERNHFEFFTFDAGGKLVSESDRNGYSTELIYDAAGDLDYVEDEDGRDLDFAWSGGRVVAIVDPRTSVDGGARTITFQYNANGDLTSYTDIGGGQWTMTYDSEHRIRGCPGSC